MGQQSVWRLSIGKSVVRQTTLICESPNVKKKRASPKATSCWASNRLTSDPAPNTPWPDDPVNCRKCGAPTGTAARRSFQKGAAPLPDQGAVDRLQIVERDCAINRAFERSRTATRDQKLKSAGFSPMSSHLKKVRALIFPVAGSISHSYE